MQHFPGSPNRFSLLGERRRKESEMRARLGNTPPFPQSCPAAAHLILGISPVGSLFDSGQPTRWIEEEGFAYSIMNVSSEERRQAEYSRIQPINRYSADENTPCPSAKTDKKTNQNFFAHFNCKMALVSSIPRKAAFV